MPSGLYPFFRRALFTLPPERAHSVALSALNFAHSLKLLPQAVADSSEAVSLMGLRFPNRVGLAAGFDKSGRYIDALGALGFGFIEVGTVTPRAQAGQSKPRLYRLPQASALINRMGFPNDGASAVAARLARRKFPGICGVNIGKNAATPIEAAVHDYVACFREVAAHADYVAVNVSSPNTKNLRQLQRVDHLRAILEALLEARMALAAAGRRIPLLAKVSPDLSTEDITAMGELVRELAIDGVIAANTTVSRPGVSEMRCGAEEGGLSGNPLQPLVARTIRILRSAVGESTPIIGVGGIASAADAKAHIRAGADLIQVYTGLIYRGPRLIREISAALHELS